MFYKRAIESGEQSLGRDHLYVCGNQTNLAVVLARQVRTRASLGGVVGRGRLKMHVGGRRAGDYAIV